MLITEPGTIDDMLADAAAADYEATERLVRDWTQHGLLDYPHKRPAGKGHGSAPALYAANQRNLFLTLLHHRPGSNISGLTRIPIAIWMYWGEEYVPLRQARRAFMRFLGDPTSKHYARDAGRASKERSRVTARAILDQMDNPRATRQARRELLDAVTEAAYTGRLDFERLERAISTVFEPGSTHVRRAIGHPWAPITTEAVITITKARLAAVTALAAGRISDEALVRARDAHVFGYAEYIARRPSLVAETPPGTPELYAPITVSDTISNCCGHLLTAIGLESMFPAEAARIRRARAGLSRPTPAVLGLTEEAIRREG